MNLNFENNFFNLNRSGCDFNRLENRNKYLYPWFHSYLRFTHTLILFHQTGLLRFNWIKCVCVCVDFFLTATLFLHSKTVTQTWPETTLFLTWVSFGWFVSVVGFRSDVCNIFLDRPIEVGHACGSKLNECFIRCQARTISRVRFVARVTTNKEQWKRRIREKLYKKVRVKMFFNTTQ